MFDNYEFLQMVSNSVSGSMSEDVQTNLSLVPLPIHICCHRFYYYDRFLSATKIAVK